MTGVAQYVVDSGAENTEKVLAIVHLPDLACLSEASQKPHPRLRTLHETSRVLEVSLMFHGTEQRLVANRAGKLFEDS